MTAMMDIDARQIEIHRIVNEEMNAQYAEEDRHGHDWASAWPAKCRCGYQAPSASRNQRVSVGVHIKNAQNKAKRTAQANIKRRMEETRYAR